MVQDIRVANKLNMRRACRLIQIPRGTAYYRKGSLFPYRVDPALLSGVRAAAKACGIDGIRMLTLRRNPGGRIAISRGFKAIIIFRMGTASSREESLSDERAAAWAAEIAVPGGDLSARDDESGP